jgi:predicted double-glycine peptidase
MMRGAAVCLCAAFLVGAMTPESAAQARLRTDTGVYTLALTSWRDMPFRTVVRQRYDFSCGSAALATLLSYHYGYPIDEATLFADMYAAGDQATIQARGFSLLDMRRRLAQAGFVADGYRLPLDRLEELNAPAIVMIAPRGYRHFVVLKGVRGDEVLVGDPAAGLMTYNRAEFERLWNGVSFVIHGEGVAGVFNRADEWEAESVTPYYEAGRPRPIEPLTRELRPLYQISPFVDLGSNP